MADYTGGYTGAVNSEAQRAQQAASAQHLMAMVRAAALAEQAQQRQRAAGGMAFNALSGALGGGIPPPPPGVPGGGPQAPMPGTNSQAQMAPPPQAAPQQAPTPAPQAAQHPMAAPPPLSAGGPAPVMPQAIPPFRPLPSAPPAAAPTGPDGIPPPPAAAAPAMAAPAPERQVVNLPSMIQALNKGQGTPEEKMEALNAIAPLLNQQQTQELKLFQAQTGALKAANEAYRKEMDLLLRERTEDRKGRQGDTRLGIEQQNADTRKTEAERRLRRSIESTTGGAAALKTTEFIYPKRDDGTIDQGAAPIGVRGVTKTGKIVVLDADGVPTTQGALGGGSAKESKGAGVLDDATALQMAKQMVLGGDRTVLTNLGRGAQGAENVIKVRKMARQVAEENGISPEGLANITAEFEGQKAGQRTLGTRTAQFGMAKAEAYEMADLVTQASAKANRTDFQPVNRALNAFQKNTGGTEIREFGAAINSFINAYARAISPIGTPTVSDKDHAREMLYTADSHDQVRAIIGQLKKEMEAAGKAPGAVRGQFREGYGDRGARTAPKKIANDAEYAALPSGTEFTGPDGVKRRKP